MKKILILGLVFFIAFGFYYSTYATNIGSTIDNFDYLEYESRHMLEHENADIHAKFNTYAPVILIILMIFNSIVFCVLSKKYNKITLKYLSVLIIILLSYIISYMYIKNKYPSHLAIVPINQHMSIGIISISVILGIFINQNKLRIIISSLPAVIMMLLVIFGGFMSYVGVQYLLEDIIIALNYLLIVEIPTQVILCPIYLSYKNK